MLIAGVVLLVIAIAAVFSFTQRCEVVGAA